MKIVLRQSSFGAFKDCTRSWFLQYAFGGMGYEKLPEPEGQRIEKSAADLGTVVHAKLEALYRNEELPVFANNENEALAKIMVDGYLDWTAREGMDFGEQTIAIEGRIELDLGFIGQDHVSISCQLDRIVLDEITGDYIVDDIKTVASLQPVMLEINQQLLTYVLAAEQNGYPCNRARHTMLKKSKRTKTATPPFYAREEIYINQEMKDNHLRHLRLVAYQMVDLIHQEGCGDHQDLVTPSPSRDCSWKCPFVSICPSMDNGDDWFGELDENFQQRTEHF